MGILEILRTTLRFRWGAFVLGGARASVLVRANPFHVCSRWGDASVLGVTPFIAPTRSPLGRKLSTPVDRLPGRNIDTSRPVRIQDSPDLGDRMEISPS